MLSTARHPAAQSQRRPVLLARGVQQIASAQLQEPAARCGWYESSYELNQGLEISEAPVEMSLALWFPAAAQLH